jgi:site-specific DNA-methyltransferase (adenine-specific)
MFPAKLAEWLILLGNGLVVDPFAGSGTTLLAASRLGRKSVGVEISEEYCEIAADRLSKQAAEFEQQGLDFGDVE